MSTVPEQAAAISPGERLALSRERLRLAMRGRSASRAGASPADGSASSLLANLKTIPGTGLLIEAVAQWWAQHPLRLASMVAAEAAGAVVRPMARRNPLGLMLGALLVGGLLAWSRPWRWLLTPALLAGLVPQVFSRLMALVPPQSWMAVLSSLLQEQRQATAPGPVQPPMPATKNE
jgi:hypothetical protein